MAGLAQLALEGKTWAAGQGGQDIEVAAVT